MENDQHEAMTNLIKSTVEGLAILQVSLNNDDMLTGAAVSSQLTTGMVVINNIMTDEADRLMTD